ncbi:MAG: 3-deoxy-8-phosphooctulonate synthase [Pseudomonadota bacterium]|jgi:2-dehydro-3-deoxyphosphooctonate aldolase (KDO 8-P synthase)|nr:3-deoxy-8-phosphooctulonate synthase [Rhodobiaceae bacterium]MEC9074681.1 3-deoxy-8-phosphooctulonate synthase [Pseudomonadota bacterium]MEC9097604.1 3-deoxy-8-phosphooctulonate synthase [Pseudomonadota bacterium]MEC9382308.1 3-deoxy-8-phosphooctulonate synthase [Pseudomonadota bacterium]MED5254212.1 3-deoxy-8-phosphooctulonate synthase [Pseudomonadota bacterium]|tara:strand:+ start:1619 stop:2446 length:828 start_codon:yes stop_codon:yes gene_type:complete
MKEIKVKEISISNNSPMTIIAGLNVLEDENMALKVAEQLKEIAIKHNIPFIFKASFDKANRSSIESYRGPGLKSGIKIFKSIKKHLDLPIITDIHEKGQIEEIAQVVDILQIPAFLCRQTDLISAACKTQLPLNIKKGQFLSPYQMKNIIDKCYSFGNDNIILCERGSSFGYDNLIVDFLGISEQKTFNFPIILDVTHSLQLPGGQGNSAGGRSHQAEDLARAAIALKISGLFIEVHPNPDEALCDGPSATRLEDFEDMIVKVKLIDDLVKSEKF